MINSTRRLLLKGGLALGGMALIGIKATTAMAAAYKDMKDWMHDRINSVYRADWTSPKRASQDNQQVQLLYKNFLGKPGSELSHKYLHMHFTDRSANIKKLAAEGNFPNPRMSEYVGTAYPYEYEFDYRDL